MLQALFHEAVLNLRPFSHIFFNIINEQNGFLSSHQALTKQIIQFHDSNHLPLCYMRQQWRDKTDVSYGLAV